MASFEETLYVHFWEPHPPGPPSHSLRIFDIFTEPFLYCERGTSTSLVLGEKCPCRDVLGLIQHTSTAFGNHMLFVSSGTTGSEKFSVAPLVGCGGNRDEGPRSDEIDMGVRTSARDIPSPRAGCVLPLLLASGHRSHRMRFA